MSLIYLDYAATTPAADSVAKKMMGYLTRDGDFGNAASRTHRLGWFAEEAVEEARNEMADLLNCDSREVVWTSGATESNNLAIKGVAEQYAPQECHFITCSSEHKAVLDPLLALQAKGYGVTFLKPNEQGLVSLNQVREAIKPTTRLISLMAVNNETGVCQPVSEIGAYAQKHNILFHVDAAQAVGKISVDVNLWCASFASFSAHKFYGPKGVGALFVKRSPKVSLIPQLHGGGHERGMRSGTLPVHQLVGMGAAATLAAELFDEESARIEQLRDQLWAGISALGDVSLNGEQAPRSVQHLNICFKGLDRETLIAGLRDVAVSSGSACTSATVEPSHVLKAMGMSDEDAHASLRFSLGRYTTVTEVERVISYMTQAVTALRKTAATR